MFRGRDLHHDNIEYGLIKSQKNKILNSKNDLKIEKFDWKMEKNVIILFVLSMFGLLCFGLWENWDNYDDVDVMRRWLSEGDFMCNATRCSKQSLCTCEEENDKEIWVVVLEWVLIVALVSLSALFSGLTLGLMSLDKIGLEIVIGGDPNSKDAMYAKKIYPIRTKGNLLLCTLLLGNVSVNAALSILLADYTSGIVGFITSTAVIVIFGEILPQAACSRYALWVGAHTLWIIRFFLVVLFPVAWPLSKALDCIFKEEIGSIYSSSQLNKLVQIHAKHEALDEDQAKMMGGALDYKAKSVGSVMTLATNIFMISQSQILDFTMMAKIFRGGYSRIPVHAEDDKNNIIGLLFTKDLILIDPEDAVTVKSVVQFFSRPLKFLWEDSTLSEALTLFKSGRTHQALVRRVNNSIEDRDPFYEICGLITLEDIIEEILQDEILDETDTTFDLDLTEPQPIDRSTFNIAHLRLLDSHHQNNLAEEEVKAIVAHLSLNIECFEHALRDGYVVKQQLYDMVHKTTVLDIPHGQVLYEKHKPVTKCTLVLSGKVRIKSGAENFISSVGPWSLIGQHALNLDNPPVENGDFSATVISEDGARAIEILRTTFESMRSNKFGKPTNILVNQQQRKQNIEPAEESFHFEQ